MPEIMDNVAVDGTVTATRFIGPLTGTASKATADASGNTITTTYATKTAVAAKQDALVSGTNIKTVNGTSLLGSGDITIGGLSGTVGTDTKPIKVVNGQAVAVTNDLVSTVGNQTMTGILTVPEVRFGSINAQIGTYAEGPTGRTIFLYSTGTNGVVGRLYLTVRSNGQVALVMGKTVNGTTSYQTIFEFS